MKHHQILPVLALTTAAVLATPAAAVAAPSPEPTPSATAAHAETPTPEAGSVEITKKDPAGDVLSGAAFLLLDSAGQEVGGGKTDAQGKLTFPDLAPGVYRLKETASGSPLHEVVADQDVIVTPSATTRLTITDPFKATKVLLQAKDNKTGKLLPGATVNIGCGEATLLTLATGPKGTTTGELPVTSKKAECWVKQVKAPAGYDVYKPSKSFSVTPGAPVTVTVTNAKTAIPPKPTPSDKPTHKPAGTPPAPTVEPSSSQIGGPKTTPTRAKPSEANFSSAASSSNASAAPADGSALAASAGALAYTGADSNAWLLAIGGLLIAAGGGALIAVRRKKAEDEEETPATN
ncbi:MSCRAMM family protein [Streptomyces nymphaeiformis]|uniref:LPXTG-motif cell wall-anchored protein n=1 Tax=Streptomyces nymphaeiformis TaxID=2663842 RepID=A0A7W7U3V3_9ACTN|nr:SpaA isopeptide-forming pilin-related protein [Streptomyces nymphaeiformis]MBB4984161.1 LPXTG-motif cell wall-anchored protein [Streptomyces nymphaeiformis]